MLPSHARTRLFFGFFVGYPSNYPIFFYNLLAWFLVSIYFAFRLAPMLPFPELHRVVALYSGLMGSFCNIKAWSTPPGMQQGEQVAQQQGLSQCEILNKFKNQGLRIQTYRYCKTCRLVRQPLTSHCKQCNYCVRKFDHHCPYIANCVGQDNLHWFVGMLLVYCIALIYYFTCSLLIFLKVMVANQVNLLSLWQAIQIKDKFILLFCGLLLASLRRTNILLFSALILISLLFGPAKTSGILDLLEQQWGSCVFLLMTMLNWQLIMMSGWPAVQGWLTGRTLKQRL